MEDWEDLKSILSFLPAISRSSTLFWPSSVVEALKIISDGPHRSLISSGETLFDAISSLRRSLSLSSETLVLSASDGYSLFFDRLTSPQDSMRWFEEVVPAMANLLLRLPSLLESHYRRAHELLRKGEFGIHTGLRLLNSQQPGIVLLSQELIGALLTCSFFCLFPDTNRDANHLPTINFGDLFASLYDCYRENQEHKIKCIIHYFERIYVSMPKGYVSFERKVLPYGQYLSCISYPDAEFWSKSATLLCPFEVVQINYCFLLVHSRGFIEDQTREALEVDFANKYLGGGALRYGCVQEEIRFMISPELIAGMLFLPAMADNEAIEIVGAERFSSYTGYASSFRFSGDYMDTGNVDIYGRRKTRIVAIDALCNPRIRQYRPKCLLREINKAFCGFLDQSGHQYKLLLKDNGLHGAHFDQEDKRPNGKSSDDILLVDEPSSSSVERNEGGSANEVFKNAEKNGYQHLDHQDEIGIATGNWGCGAFGGDPELKAMTQWLGASQASRPSISYYTFGIEALQHLDQVTQWILSHEWTVGDLWNMLVEYSSQVLNGETTLGFLTWLLPSTHNAEAMMVDLTNTP
ncbi:poly(ADP-ribose) glycohydrolase 1-like isoform X1 [Tripterygium wilfordii]|uniref:poly(ADP-ribose) glycohydrolase 1-like isoform X1 n=1 Tax=Tripterygium wilfordii TaxID=458696 RepID=UPI0018F8447A|nr:poly(ADP-ribose) glycohydrolase 1-like isoform X1 [Tripterygium wilfordii]